jgi:hypothetical protein
MKLKEKAEMQRLLGNIEGIAFACEENIRNLILDSIAAIDEILNKSEGDTK